MNLPTIIDIEASGLGRGSYPIEVGFITGSGQTGCTLIKPEPHWQHWNQEAEILHGISREVIASKGKDIEAVASWLNENLAGQIVYSDGWVNDMCWLGQLFDEAGMVQAFRIESLLSLLSIDEREQWTPIHNQIIEETDLKRHRASSDAKMIQDTYAQIKGFPRN
jgi:hypothetical protein